ncbi:MAG TPA: DUF3574 domain-containing protein [Gemmatimonadaceae bacterium]|jgi:hypothetical protein|nr:DUF3574 domain-containing protein [Gemmatimonadaceae bacterium]
MVQVWIRAVALGLTLGACGGLNRPDGLRSAHVERLYFGRNIGDTAVVSDSAWNGFVRTVLSPAFPAGATVWDAAGQWRAPNGELVREQSFVVELVHVVTPESEQRVQWVMADYKRRFAQQSVLRLVTTAWAAY